MIMRFKLGAYKETYRLHALLKSSLSKVLREMPAVTSLVPVLDQFGNWFHPPQLVHDFFPPLVSAGGVFLTA